MPTLRDPIARDRLRARASMYGPVPAGGGYRDHGGCGTIAGMVRGPLGLLLPLAGSALAVWLSTLLHIGITTSAKSGWGTVGTVVLVAVIFGLVNLLVKPIAKLVGCGLYVL